MNYLLQLKTKITGSLSWSVAAILFCLLLLNITANSERVFFQQRHFHYDGGGYYAYLPAYFIYNDFSWGFYDSNGLDSKEFTYTYNGRTVNKYAVGVALLQAPFFWVGHYTALHSGKFEPNGFTKPYTYWLFMGCLTYLFLAMICLKKVLSYYFPDYVVALSLLILVCGTNLLYYSVFELTMSHVYSFFLFSLLLFLTHRWLLTHRAAYLVAIGCCLGIIATVRLPNVVVMLVSLLWGITSLSDMRARIALLWQQKGWVALSLAACFLFFFPQLLNYKLQSGIWTINLYQNEPFYWDQPLIGRVLFGFRKGWFVYCPLLLLGLAGFVWLRRYAKSAVLAVSVFCFVNLYLVSAWWCWWYGGSFGMRALIEMSAIWSIPLSACLYRITQTYTIKYFFTAFLPLLLVLNLLQVNQYVKGVIHWEAMTPKAYFDITGAFTSCSR